MKSLTAIAVGMGIFAVGACDTIPKPGTRSYLSVATRPHRTAPLRTIGTLFVWSNDVNAGMVYESGHVCMQRAMTMEAMTGGGSASVPSSLVSLSEAARTALAEGDSESAIAISGAISQAATALSTTTERTAFLDIGMFYLCQLEANRAITPDQSAMLTQQLIRDAATIRPVTGYLPGVAAPAMPNVPPIAGVGERRGEEPEAEGATGEGDQPPTPADPVPPVAPADPANPEDPGTETSDAPLTPT